MAEVLSVLDARSWLRYIVNHPYRIILAILLITILFAYHLPNLRFQTSIYDLVIEDLPETVRYQTFKKEFGCEEIILVVLKTQGVLEEGTFREIERLSGSLSEIKGVRKVISLPDIKKSMELTGQWSLEEFAKIIAPITLFERNLVSKDRKTTVISLILEDTEDKDRIIAAVSEIAEPYKKGFTLYQIGMPNVSKYLAEFTEQDFLRLPPITYAVIAVILFLVFRSFRGFLIPAGSVLAALIWTFGLMAVTGTPLSMLTMIVPVFLIAVGTAYCLYIFSEYLAASKEAQGPAEASFQCFRELSFPTALAVLTTVIGLGSLLINRIEAIREFAIFSCFGIISMLVILLTFVPAVMAALPLPRGKRESKPSTDIVERLLAGITRVNLNHQKIAFTVLGLIALAGILGITRIHVETNPVDYFKEDAPVTKNFHDVYRDMAGSFPVNVVMDSGERDFFEKPENLKQLAILQEFLDRIDGVDKTISFLDYLKLVNYASNQYQEQFYVLPEEGFEVRMLVNNFKTMLGNDMLLRFMSEDFSKANVMMRTHISSSKDFLSAEEKIQGYLKEKFPQSASYVTGLGVVISQSSQLLTEGQVKSLFLTLAILFCIMFLLFMSLKVGLIGIVPNCFPIIVNFGLMGWLGIPLSTASSLVASVAIGLAVDDTIHYLVKYNREFKKDLDKHRALKETILRVGKPILFTTLTVSLGFSVLMFSSFKPTAVFGFMMLITLVSALIGDLILLPGLMLHAELVTLWDLLRLKLGRDPEKGIPLFDGLSRNQVHYILMAGALKQYEGEEVIIRKGEVSDSMYAVISGELEVVDIIEEGQGETKYSLRKHIGTLGPGDTVGEMGMIRSCQRSATVIATKPGELLQINDRMIKRLHWLYPPTAQKFFFNLMTVICNRLENLTNCYLEASIYDSLSGLYNRDYFMETLRTEVARAGRYRTPFGIFIMDIDNLKGINQRYGYRAGDFILIETGKLLKAHMRGTDTLCRFGGRQFAALLGHGEVETASGACERFRSVLVKHCFQLDAHAIYVTASFGVSLFDPEAPKTAAELVGEALRAMERAKTAGKNRVETPGQTPSGTHG